jgi:hypothetical protein
MRKRAIIGALLLVGVGVFLGGTVLRDQVASARTLAQDVFVNNTAANPVPVQEQGTVSVAPQVATRVGRCSAFEDELKVCTFDPPIQASLITIRPLSETIGVRNVIFRTAGGEELNFFSLEPLENVVLPLPQPLIIQSVKLFSLHPDIDAEVNVVGS